MKRLLAVLFVLIPAAASAGTYEVGPGQTYSNIGDLPWESLAAGDLVLIHHRTQPYQEKWVIAVQATEQQPFTVRGVPGAGGELPVIDGRDATTRSQLDFWNEPRGVIKIGGADSPAVDMPTWIVLESLDIRSGRSPFSFTGHDGVAAYTDNAASVYIENGQNVTVRNCNIHDSGNGIFVSHESRNVTIEAAGSTTTGSRAASTSTTPTPPPSA